MAEWPSFTIGGSVQAGGGIYIPRDADRELLELCQEGTFAYVLTPRQMGKSSLMYHTQDALEEEGVRTVVVDITQLGAQLSADSWYLGILTLIEDQLEIETDVLGWWSEREHLGLTQRFTQFLADVVLNEIEDPVTIFVDEIDSTLSLEFTDDFFASIRYLYNARAQVPAYKRLTFVLIGVATPSDLIIDPKRTPFNIGQRIELTDFTFEEAAGLAPGFSVPREQAEQMIRWVLDWTGGHPYLTLRLCDLLARRGESCSEKDVAETVAIAFFGEQSDKDNNLQFVRDMLTERAPDKQRILELYRNIRRRRPQVLDDEQSLLKTHLKLSGIVRRDNGVLRIRNRIYERVFDRRWVNAHWPVPWYRRVPIPVQGLIAALVVIAVVLAMLAASQRELAQQERFAAQTASRLAAERLKRAEDQGKATEEAERLQRIAEDARKLAEARQELAESEKERAEKEKERAEKERERAEKEKERAERERERAESEKERAEHERQEATRQRDRANKAVQTMTVNSAKRLIREAQFQQATFHRDELGVLLARQAYNFSSRLTEEASRLTDETSDESVKALRAALLRPNFHRVISRDSSPVQAVSISHGGGLAASSTEAGKISLWYLGDGMEEREISPQLDNKPIRSVALSRDDKLLAFCGGEGALAVWDITEDALKWRSQAHQSMVNSVAFSPDGRFLASASDDSTVRIWDASTGKELKVLTGHEANANSVAFSPGGKWLASGGERGSIRLWSATSYDQHHVLDEHESAITAMAFSPAGDLLASTDANGVVRVWHLHATTITSRQVGGHGQRVNSVSFHSDGAILVTTSEDDTIGYWHATGTPNQGHRIPTKRGDLNTAQFMPDGKQLLFGGDDGSLAHMVLADLPEEFGNLWGSEEFKSLYGHTSTIGPVAISPDGQIVAAGSGSSGIRLWNLDRASPRAKTLLEKSQTIWAVAFTPDSRTLVSGGDEGEVRLWNLEEFRSNGTTGVSRMLPGQNGRVRSLVVHPDGKRVVSGSANGEVRIFDLEPGKDTSRLLTSQGQAVHSLSVHPDGLLLASVAQGHSVRIWQMEPGKEGPHKTLNHGGQVKSVSFSPDGRYLAADGDDGVIRLWRVSDLDADPRELEKGEKRAWSVVFSPDSAYLASSLSDSVGFWKLSDLDAGPVVIKGKDKSATGLWLAFHPGGRFLALGQEDRSLGLWHSNWIVVEDLLDIACQTSNRNLTLREWWDFVGPVLPYERTCPDLVSHPSVLKGARKLASDGDLEGARSLYTRLGELGDLGFEWRPEYSRLAARGFADRALQRGSSPTATPTDRDLQAAWEEFREGVRLDADLVSKVPNLTDVAIDVVGWKARSLADEAKFHGLVKLLDNARRWVPDYRPRTADILTSSLLRRTTALVESADADSALTRHEDSERGKTVGQVFSGLLSTYQTGFDIVLGRSSDGHAIVSQALMDVGVAQGELGWLGQAEEAFRRAKALNPSLPVDPVDEARRLVRTFNETRGKELARAGEINEALRLLREARSLGADLDPNSTVARLSPDHRALSGDSRPADLLPGTKVRRGQDWQWENQDGGAGKIGTVTESVAESGGQGWLSVEWDENAHENRYRWGANGKFDLVVVSLPTESEERE